MSKNTNAINLIKTCDKRVAKFAKDSGMGYFAKRRFMKSYNNFKYDVGVDVASSLITSAVCTTANLAGKGIVKTGEVIGYGAVTGVKVIKRKAAEAKIKSSAKKEAEPEVKNTAKGIKKFAFKKKASANENVAVTA